MSRDTACNAIFGYSRQKPPSPPALSHRDAYIHAHFVYGGLTQCDLSMSVKSGSFQYSQQFGTMSNHLCLT
ncbi:hypothetical protein MAR_014124 [Mya arenaria]|uniref:Uncharacterized protein n=1 Tax=Mya arenaria TaxID=6604 RepID=A0ABY7G1T9_MYAAR|nr:hypothetical protein MAR_014124 [Mya arenaria]